MNFESLALCLLPPLAAAVACGGPPAPARPSDANGGQAGGGGLAAMSAGSAGVALGTGGLAVAGTTSASVGGAAGATGTGASGATSASGDGGAASAGGGSGASGTGGGGGAGGAGGAGAGGAGAGGAGAGAGGAGGGASGAGVGGSAGGGAPGDVGAHCSGCTRTEVGSPTWEFDGAVMVVANVPAGPAGPLDCYGWEASFSKPNHVFDYTEAVIGPLHPHAPPYNDELASMATRAGVVPKQTFTLNEFTAPKGIAFLVVVLPRTSSTATGSSFDFASGPIVPNTTFPIVVDGDLYRDGVLYDPDFDSHYIGYDQFTPPIAADGPSHFIVAWGENSSFGPAGVESTGSYELKVSAIDATGYGWKIVLPFVVTN